MVPCRLHGHQLDIRAHVVPSRLHGHQLDIRAHVLPSRLHGHQLVLRASIGQRNPLIVNGTFVNLSNLPVTARK